MSSILRRAARTLGRAVGDAAAGYRRGGREAGSGRARGGADGTDHMSAPPAAALDGAPAHLSAVVYDVDRLGLPPLRYAPQPDDLPDPGEVVWTWVPYEEDPERGKDRPVLVLARSEGGFVVSQMTSQDHDRDAEQEARHGRHWIDVGSGSWDARGRPSEARLDRLLLVRAGAVRRTGGSLDRRRFEEVVAALRAHHER